VIVSDTLLVAFADGELGADLMRQVERAVSDNPDARREVGMFRETAMLLRAACPDGLYAGAGTQPLLPAMMRPAGVRRRILHRFERAVAASVAAVVIGFGGGAAWTAWPPSERTELVDEVAEYHSIYAADTPHLVEVSANHTAELAAWLGRRLERNEFKPPDLAMAGLQLAGGRLLAVSGRPVAQLMYTRERGEPVALCLMRTDAPAAPMRMDRRGALRLTSWQDGAFAYVVAGELDEAAILDIARRAALQL
jgi:anti-sigma factor RsiW